MTNGIKLQKTTELNKLKKIYLSPFPLMEICMVQNCLIQRKKT